MQPLFPWMVKDISRSLLSKVHAGFLGLEGDNVVYGWLVARGEGYFSLALIQGWVQRKTSWLHALAVSSAVAHAVPPSCDVPNTAPFFQLSPHEFARLLHRPGSPCSIVLNGWAYVIYENVMCNLAWC